MKKIILSSLLIAGIAVAITGCLKDKGFENNEYGINDPGAQPPGVGFPLGTKTQSFGLNVSASPQAVNDMILVNLESVVPAKSDVTVTLKDNSAALTAAYNTANGLTGSSAVSVLPSALYSFSTTVKISAGGRFNQIPINVSNTTTLDPNKLYAAGFAITAVDGGYKIAENLKDLLVVFSIKNRLDGVYEFTGAALRAGDPVLSGNFGPYERSLATSGTNSVQWIGSVPWANGSGTQLPGGFEPNITVDPTTNSVTSITSGSGTFMTAPVVRTDIVGATQRYDPSTKTLYFEFSYGGGPTSRLFSFKGKYVRAR